MKDFFMRILLTLTFLLTLSWNGMNTCLAADTPENLDKENMVLIDTNFVNLPDTVLLQISDCTSTAPLCMDLPISEIPSYQLTANGSFYNLGFEECDIDTITRYFTFPLVSSGPFNLVSWNINQSNVATNNSFATIDQLEAILNSVDPTGNWIYDPVNGSFTGGDDTNVYSDIVIFEVSLNTTQTLALDEFPFSNGTEIRFPQGTTDFVVTESSTGLKDTFVVNVFCVQNDTTVLNLNISDSTVECFDYSELPGDPASITFVCPANSGFVSNSLLVNGDSCLVITTVAGGTDIYCIEICDDLGICDTSTYIVNVSVPGTPGTSTFEDTLLVGSSGLYCINTGALNGAPDTFYNICPSGVGESVSLFLNQDNYCVFYNGFSVGQDSACIVICDDMSICDTTIMYFTVQTLAASFYYDTVFLNTTETYCDFDLSELPGTLTSIDNGCAGNTGGFVDFMVDAVTNCVSYEGLAVGKDTACIYLTDDMGNQDTVFMVVCSSEPITETIIDTIRIDLTVSYCLDASQLGGTVTDTVFFCDPQPSTNVTLTPIAGSLCFDVTGEVVGTESFCVYICDDFGFCDTTNFLITVTDEVILDLPTANADSDTTAQNSMVVTNVCNNDILPNNEATTFFVLSPDNGGIGPTNGQAFVNDDCTITYTPDVDFCGSSDAYSYVICNSTGCDTAFVNIYVSCPEDSAELTFFNGFSPNGDGVNDFWEIRGIESLPNNVLSIFNRWGNQVLKIEGYTNDVAWGGDWEGLDLPDGIYFYLLEHGNEQGDQSSGWIMVSR